MFKGTIGVSGRSLMFAVDDELMAYDLESCTQTAPTVSPSATSLATLKNPLLTGAPSTILPSATPTTLSPTISSNPTELPSSSTLPTVSAVPTTAPSKSQEPTISLAPTICYDVDITLLFGLKPDENYFELRSVDEDSDTELGTVLAFGPDWPSILSGGDFYRRSICLQEGTYDFIMYDTGGSGMCCELINGYYRAESNGQVIAEGNESWGFEETTRFTLPFSG